MVNPDSPAIDPLPNFPSASFHALAEALKNKLKRAPFALQIGAMDGVHFDLLHPHLSAGGWEGVLVEPLPDMFEKLQEAYAGQPNLRFANCAVSDYDGTLTLYRVDPAAVEKGLVFREALGITSAYRDRGVFGDARRQRGQGDALLEHTRRIDVPCCTLANLLTRYNVSYIDLMVIDTEGADWMIARQLDLGRYTPTLICIEYTGLNGDEMRDCCEHFQQQGYQLVLCAEDNENLLFVRTNP